MTALEHIPSGLRPPRTDFSSPPAPPPREFDGVICFGGEDWWYHNRGHFDLQMMRELSRDLPVLYVNSVGLRMPSPREGAMFIRRVARKLRSLSRGLVSVRENFSVLSPLAAPGRLGAALTGPLLAPQVRRAARALGIRHPLVWVACPPAAAAVDALDPVAVIYQRTDRHECYSPGTGEQIARLDWWLKARADLTLYCSRWLLDEEWDDCRQARFVDHGVDFDTFAAAGAAQDRAAEPRDVRHLPRPRIGFIGGIDRHTFDPDLFVDIAHRLPEAQFILVGACSLPGGWCGLPNVAQLGRRPYEQVARYMAACDVLIMPWNRSRWIEACNPVKLKEYLAVGRPVISTSFEELARYDGLLQVADDAAAFADAIRAALDDPGDPAVRRDFVRGDAWALRADEVRSHLRRLGIVETRRSALRDAVVDAAGVDDPIVRETGAPPRIRLSTGDDVLAVIGPAATAGTRPASLRLAGDADPPLHGVTPGAAVAAPAACLILAGGLEPSPIVRQAGRHVLDLPITAQYTMLQRWIEAARSLAGHSAPDGVVPVRIIAAAHLPAPTVPAAPASGVTLHRDPRAWRGPGGALRDAARAYPSRASLLVVEASRCLAASLAPMVRAHEQSGADVTVAVNADRSPAGIWLIRAGALATIPDLGYVDLKEQWLPALRARGGDVRIHILPGPGALPVRRLDQLLAAARAVQPLAVDGAAAAADVRGLVRTRAAQGLRVICPGALLGPGAVVIDSIVMTGAFVPADATVIRSLICPGARIQAGTDIADAVVTAPARLSDQGSTGAG